ncbi:MAG: methyltransferase family protein [Candidatus Aminicenantaceae bacterium]
MSESFIDLVYRWRVRSGVISAVLALTLADPKTAPLIAGIVLSLCGLALRAWSSGHIRKEKELTVSGPYRFTRNPLYLGNFLIGTGIVAGCWSWWVFLVFALYFSVFYPVVITREKKKMQRMFPDEYQEYDHNVPLFFPRGTPASGSDKKFSWKCYAHNREIRALAGVGLFWVLVVSKMLIMK